MVSRPAALRHGAALRLRLGVGARRAIRHRHGQHPRRDSVSAHAGQCRFLAEAWRDHEKSPGMATLGFMSIGSICRQILQSAVLHHHIAAAAEHDRHAAAAIVGIGNDAAAEQSARAANAGVLAAGRQANRNFGSIRSSNRTDLSPSAFGWLWDRSNRSSRDRRSARLVGFARLGRGRRTIVVVLIQRDGLHLRTCRRGNQLHRTVIGRGGNRRAAQQHHHGRRTTGCENFNMVVSSSKQIRDETTIEHPPGRRMAYLTPPPQVAKPPKCPAVCP